MPCLPCQKHRIILGLFSLGLALSLTIGHLWSPHRAIAQAPTSARDQVQQGVEQYQRGDFQGAIASWETASGTYAAAGNLQNQAITAENLARAYRRLGDADTALRYWAQTVQAYAQLDNQEKLGRMLTEQAQTYTRLGQYQQAIGLLCGIGKPEIDEGGPGESETSERAPSETCSSDSAVGIAQTARDTAGTAAALGSLGEAYRLRGSDMLAESALKESLDLAQELGHSAYVAAATNSLGSVYLQRSRISDRRADDAAARGDNQSATSTAAVVRESGREQNESAIEAFEQSLAAASDEQDQVRALLSLVPAYHRAGQLAAAKSYHAQAVALLDQISDSRTKAYATIDLANLLPLTLSLDVPRESLAGSVCPLSSAPTQTQQQPSRVRTQAEALLQQAIATAEATGDYRAQSFAYGKLGHLYECAQRYSKALSFTKDAEWAADQALKSRDSLYLWQWQTGRILNKQDQAQAKSAIDSYEAAVTTLEKIRSDILTADRDLQFDFRDAVEPVYRELAELQLDQAPTSEMVIPQEDDDTAKNISAALTTIDSLRLAELQNYFGDECIILASIDPGETDDAASASYPKTGIFSTFITDDRTAVVLTLPNGQRRVEWLPESASEINQMVNDFRLSLEVSLYIRAPYDPNAPGPNRFNTNYNPSLSASLYDKLIRPFSEDLEATELDIDTLVFIQDGIFRSIPMAALYDGEQYLIERYAIAITPSLSLTALTPSPRRRLRALALGISEAVTVEGQDFKALVGVDQELDKIKQRLPGSQSLLNSEFTLESLRQELQDTEYSIIHMATHGEFGAEPQDTFLVTGEGKKLTISDLEEALRQSGGTQQIDLLTLTACKTAIGDNRATLGLAGVAVQAGARSAVASLWSIDDLSTATIVDNFYNALKDPDLTKAEALREAQLVALNSGDQNRLSRPGYWAPFLLIGDWQ
ncbi:MAG: CHAT domain-containing protein [Elainellaceae cyanobacterium]